MSGNTSEAVWGVESTPSAALINGHQSTIGPEAAPPKQLDLATDTGSTTQENSVTEAV